MNRENDPNDPNTWKRCVAVPGQDSLIDIVGPDGRTAINRETLEEVRKRHPHAELMTIEQFFNDKAARQEIPLIWEDTDKETYDSMLNCLPPARWIGGAFLVGEPMDHHAITGRARFSAFKQEGEKYYASNRPLTIAEFEQLFKQP